jgi:hypothetical protein
MTSLILTGQNIIPIPADTTSQWRISRGYYDGLCVNWYNSIYYIDGTIEFNGKVFYKIFETGDFYQAIGSPPGPCNQTYSYSGVYRGSIRSENGKTYELYENEEYLLMDFTLNAGDTLFSYITPGLVIESIDSVLVGTKYRKRFNFLDWGEFNWMIEGVGHAFGLFEPMGVALSFSSEFHCYGENNVPLFGDLNCTLNVGYEDFSAQNNNVSIYPNPTSGRITIEASELTNTIKSYFLTDMYGRMIFEKNIESVNSLFEIDLDNYKSGIYFLRISTDNQGIIFRKIIKN